MPLSNSLDRKSTRLNSSHLVISYAVFCLKKKNKIRKETREKERDRHCDERITTAHSPTLWPMRAYLTNAHSVFAFSFSFFFFFFLMAGPPQISPLSPHAPLFL